MAKRGRPAQFDEPMRESIRIRVTPAQREDLLRVSREVQMPVATLIREAVNCFVADFREGDGPFRGPEVSRQCKK